MGYPENKKLAKDINVNTEQLAQQIIGVIESMYGELEYSHDMLTDIGSALYNVLTKLNGKADSGHTHTKSQITDFAHSHTRSQITDFTHRHDDLYYTETEVDNLLNKKAPSYSSGTTDIGAGSALETGKLHFVYDE